MGSTIFALATPSGRSGVAVMRISGPQAFQLADKIGAKGLLKKPRQAILCASPPTLFHGI